jgi:hypothetical protein
VDASYLYEALNGAWLGYQRTEYDARMSGASVTGANLVTNGTFDTDVSGGWAVLDANNAVSWSAGRAKCVSAAANGAFFGINIGATSAGQTIKITFDSVSDGAASCKPAAVLIGTAIGTGNINNTMQADVNFGSSRSLTHTFTGTSANTFIWFYAGTGQGVGNYILIDNVVVKAATAPVSSSGPFYQGFTDGKYYRLWKNLLKATESFNDAAWNGTTNLTITTGVTDPNGGAAAARYTATGVNAQRYQSFTTSLSGLQATNSMWIRRVTGTGVVRIYGVDGTTFTDITASLTGSWQRFSAPTTAGFAGTTYFGAEILIATSGDAIEVAFPQTELGTTATTYESKATTDGTQTETFRGNTARFPRMAAIVAEASRVVIYDLLSPGRPMWMVFVRGSTINVGTYLSASATSVNAVTAGGGVVSVALGGSQGLALINFAADRSVYKTIGGSQLRPGTIAQRNVEYTSTPASDGGPGIANSGVNSVATFTYPDAPVDPITGLQVPTIAVGTNAGYTVLKHDGTGVNGFAVGGAVVNEVKFDQRGRLYVTASNGTTAWALWLADRSFANTTLVTSNATYTSGSVTPVIGATSGAVTRGVPAGRMVAVLNTTPNVVSLTVPNEASLKGGLMAYVHNTYNTGWMAGDIRRCLLADVSAGTADSTEKITNGTFATNLSGWTTLASTGSVTWDASGAMKFTNVDTTDTAAYQDVSGLVVGQTYQLNFTTATVSGSPAWVTYIMNPADGTIDSNAGSVGQGWIFTAVRTTQRIQLTMFTDGAHSGTVDNVSLKAVAVDRSYKAKPSAINGTIAKTAVGAGSQLVAYGPFSNSNYVREAYSADLDFGTGGFDVMPWVSIPATSSNSSGQQTLPAGSFGAVSSVSLAMNTAAWTKGTGWTAPTASTFSCDGTQVAATDLTWSSGNGMVTGFYRKWTVTVSAISGTMNVYANNVSPVAITTPGTYTVFGEGGSTLIRMTAAGTTCTGSLVVEEVAPACIVSRAFSSGAKFELGVSPFGYLHGIVTDGTTTRTVLSGSWGGTGTTLAGSGWILPELSYATSGSLTLKVDGVQVGQTTGNPLLTLNNASAVLTLGNNFGLTAPFPGSISITDIGAVIPSDDASLWMFQQERAMFRDGAQVSLPDSGTCLDLSYDDVLDRWRIATAANESEFAGLVRTASAGASAGTIALVGGRSGMKLVARITTNPGVDVTIPAQNAMAEWLRRAEEMARIQTPLPPADWMGAFTANTVNGSALITVTGSSLVIPAGATAVGARVSGTGVPASTTILAVNGTQVQLSNACTALGSGVTISMLDLILPVGQSPHIVNTAGAGVREGSAFAWQRSSDGFRERVSYISAPGNQWLQVETRKAA